MPTPTTPQRKLTSVYLGGNLGRVLGRREWQLNVSSPAEALRAIDTNTKGALMRYLGKDGRDRYYKVALGRIDQLLEPGEIQNRSGTTAIYIWPTVKGRNSGTAKIVAGVVILAIVSYFTFGVGSAAFYSAGTAATSTTAGTAGGLTFLGSVTVGIATSLILGGISQLLAPHPNSNAGDQLGSNIFQGAIAGGQQGGCVPVLYGRALVTPIPISLWFGNVDYNTTQNAYVGAVQFAGLPGGGSEYTSLIPNPVSDDTDSGP